MKSKFIKIITTCVLIGFIGFGGYFGYKKFLSPKPAMAATSYITVTAKKTNIQVNVQGTGSAYAATSKDIVANNSGEIKNLDLKVGDTVKTGTKLFLVDSDQLRQNLDKTQSDLDKQKLQLSKAKTEDDIAMQNLNVASAQKQVDYALDQLNKMTVKSPINGVVVAKNNNNGDSVQSGKAVLTIVDPSSIKIKVAVDELDVSKVKQGQKAEIKFDALKDKTYEGTVDEIAQVGNSTNNVTTYDVTVTIKDPTDIKLGMNGNVNIIVDNKEDALTIPSEALIERNGNKYVMVPNTGSTGGENTGSNPNTQKQNENTSNNADAQKQNESTPQGKDEQTTSNLQKGSGQYRGTNGQQQGTASQGRSNNRTSNGFSGSGSASKGKLVQIKTGLENENYIEVLEGLTEGQQVLVSLPQTTSTNTTNLSKNGMNSGFGGFGGAGGFGGNMGGRNQTNSSSQKK